MNKMFFKTNYPTTGNPIAMVGLTKLKVQTIKQWNILSCFRQITLYQVMPFAIFQNFFFHLFLSMKIWKFHFFARFAYLLQDILTYCYVLLLTSMGFCDDYEKNKIMLQDLILKRNQLPINYLSTIKAMKFNSNEIFLTVRNIAGLSGSTGVNGFSSFTSQNHRYMSFCGLLCSEGVF